MNALILAKEGLPEPLTHAQAAIAVGAVVAGVFAAVLVAALRATFRTRAGRTARASYPNV